MANSTSIAQSEMQISAPQEHTSPPSEKLEELATAIKPLTAFTVFMNLSPELRLKIWAEVCKNGRVVDIKLELLNMDMTFEALTEATYPVPYRYRSVQGIPPIMRVSREARIIGLEHCTPEFSTKCVASPADPSIYVDSHPSAYVSWELDTLYVADPKYEWINRGLPNKQLILYKELAKLKKIRSLAINPDVALRGAVAAWTEFRVWVDNHIEDLIVYLDKDVTLVHNHNPPPVIYDPDNAVRIHPTRYGNNTETKEMLKAIRMNPRDVDSYSALMCEVLMEILRLENMFEDGDLQTDHANWKPPTPKFMVMATSPSAT